MIFDDTVEEQVQEQPAEQPAEEIAAVAPLKSSSAKATEDRQSAPQESWKALRDKAERAERERDEAIRYAQSLQQQKPQEPEEEDIYLKPDDLAEGKHVSKLQKEIKKLKQQQKEYEQRTTQLTAEARLRSQYPDFDKVVNADSIARLQAQDPEIIDTLKSSSDDYSKAVAAYKIIKKLDIVTEDNFKEDRERAQANAAKPKPMAALSPGDSALGRANAFVKFDDKAKKQLYAEMMEARKGY